FSYSGFVNGENASVVSGSPDLSTTATPASSVGPYPIFISQGTLSAANYSFNYVNGTLSIVPTTVPIQRTSNTSLTLPPTPPAYGYGLVVLTNNAGANISFPDIVGFATPPGETNRLFIIEKTGRISVITDLK